MSVKVVLIDPVQEEQYYQKEKDEVWDLKDVKRVEAPYVEGYH